MKLQQLMTQRIDDFGGIEKLTKDLKRLRTFSHEKKWFDNMIIYFNSLYTNVYDVEAYAREYYQTSIDTIEFLERYNQNKKGYGDIISFLVNLITFKLDYVSGVKNMKIG